MKLRLDMLARVTGGTVVRGNPGRELSGVTTDSRAVKPGQIFFALRGAKFDGHKFVAESAQKGAAAAVVDGKFKGKARAGFGLVRVPDTLFALGELARFERARLAVKVLGITGSVGKTTTKEMAAAVLAKKFRVSKSPGNFNNLIGVPLAIFGISPKAQVAVLELASNGPGEIARLSEIAQPECGVIVRIAPAHLQGLKSLEGVEAEKRALMSALGPNGTFIFNLADPRLCRLAMGFAGRRIGFGFRAPVSNCAEMEVRAERAKITRASAGLVQEFRVKQSGKAPKSAMVRLKAAGGHLVENALAALAAGLAMGVSLEQGASALSGFEPGRGRGKMERLSNGAWMIDESYNASPESMKQALRAFAEYGRRVRGRKILVLGEMAELGGYSGQAHRELGEVLRKTAFDRLYYLGGFSQELAAGLGKALAAKIQTCADLGRLKALAADLGPGDLVMLKSSHATGLWQIADWLREK